MFPVILLGGKPPVKTAEVVTRWLLWTSPSLIRTISHPGYQQNIYKGQPPHLLLSLFLFINRFFCILYDVKTGFDYENTRTKENSCK